MSVNSFNKKFIIANSEAVEIFLNDLKNPVKVISSKRDYDADSKKGLMLLKKKLKSLLKPHP